MTNYRFEIASLLLDTFDSVFFPLTKERSAIETAIEVPKDSKLGDFAFPCFALAKELKLPPAEIVKRLAVALEPRLSGHPSIVSIAPAGGYLNFVLKKSALAADIIPAILDGSFLARRPSRNERLMVEYSQPNTHKAIHVGHIRCASLGDALWRIFDWCGYDTIPVNYIGDEGTHVARCLWYYTNYPHDEVPSENRGEFLGKLYTAATSMLDRSSLTDVPLEEISRREKGVAEVLRKIESGDPEMRALWQETKSWSMEDLHRAYEWLNCRFDRYFFESECTEISHAIVKDFLDRGIFIESDGAIGIDLRDAGLGFCLLRKRDGNILYATRDLALARLKFDEFKVDRSIYVVDSGQSLHFRQVFKCLELMGFEQGKKCHHVAYAQVVRPDGKMSSRKGNVILFSELKSRLLSKILSEFLEKYRGEWPDEEISEAAHLIALATMRYGMLNQDNNSLVTFDLDEWTSRSGNTGPYMLYAYARIQSILREVGEVDPRDADWSLLTHEAEVDLLTFLAAYPEIIERAAKNFAPNGICSYIYELAKRFSRFYHDCSVAFAETEKLKITRGCLAKGVGEVLRSGLGVLGIGVVERM